MLGIFKTEQHCIVCPTYLLKYKVTYFIQHFFSTMNWHIHLEIVHFLAWYADTKWKKKETYNKAFLINYLPASWTSVCPSTPQ